MNHAAILATRLTRQRLTQPSKLAPADVAAHLCAIQAQDFAGAKWSLGQRCYGLTDAGAEQLLAEKKLIRISSLRGTLHLMHPKDVRWITALVTPRIKLQAASLWKKLGVDDAILSKALHHIDDALKNNEALTRAELKSILDKRHIDTTDHRMNQFLTFAGLQQVVCCGPRRGKEFTYVLLRDWLPDDIAPMPKHPLTELAIRYLESHSPATAEDFSWWSGFPVTACRRAFEDAGITERFVFGEKTYFLPNGETASKPDGKVRLLSGFDEYYISYADRSLVAENVPPGILSPPNGILPYLVVSKGKIVGTWRREIGKKSVEMVYIPFGKTAIGEERLSTAAKTYGKFMGLPAQWAL
ncbi:winged helix DNA-binding domain-containing protein [Chitinophaga pollutisoli]|uniref:Winged helix DNA-binding domain-containing protein n=1 Tax=Chitinophaga pollutisoli TaxID=3133966 RepID=A0ABZ2YJB0_9BACT